METTEVRCLDVFEFDDALNGKEWRYRFYPTGWQWGHFKSQAAAKAAGDEHLARANKFGNDWGVSMDEVPNILRDGF